MGGIIVSLLIKEAIKRMPTGGLFVFVEDIQNRIGSHVAQSDIPDQNYIDYQKHLINLVSEELELRENRYRERL